MLSSSLWKIHTTCNCMKTWCYYTFPAATDHKDWLYIKSNIWGKKYAPRIISSLVSSCFCFFHSDVQAWMFPRGAPSTLRPGWCNKYLTLREQYYTFAALHKWMNSFAEHLWKKNPLNIAYEKGLMNNHICNLFFIFQEYLFKQVPAYKVVQE